ncbi:MAG TPA: hypothetical protein VHW00_04380 [Thermoanaerobaculia bacterium]|nr:hypothetical protein [Thermoanaerobaculia bacterium]
MKKLAIALSLVLLTTGCFEIDESIEIRKDMSGTADFHLGVDLEPMVVIMAQLGKEMEGKKGPLTAAELKKAKEEFKKKSKTEKSSKPPSREDVSKDLPPGIKLLDFAATEREFGLDTKFKFAFDKLSNLADVKLPSKEGGDPTQKNVVDSPFEGLEVIDKGKTFTVQTKPHNPTESVEKEAEQNAPKMDPEMEKMMKDAFSKMRVSYRITAPFEVVSHNATRVEGKTLIWEYTYASFEKMSKKGVKPEDAQVRVTFKK